MFGISFFICQTRGVALVGDFLRDEVRIVDALDLTGVTPDRLRAILRRVEAAADDLGDERPKRQRRLLHLLLHRVMLHPDSIHIALKRSGLGSLGRLLTLQCIRKI